MNFEVGKEHPWCDHGQLFFFSIFIIGWALDSFVFHWSVFFVGPINLVSRIILSTLCFIIGISIENGSKKVLLNQVNPDPHIIDYGVFRFVRHPVYLGVLVILLGLFFWSFSLISLIILSVFFLFYDKMASYEEEDFTRIFGEEYSRYKKKVRKWIPKVRVRMIF